MIVLDASAALELPLRATDQPSLLTRVLESGDTIAAPHLIDLEVTQVVRRYVLRGELSEDRGRIAIDDHLAMGIVRYPHEGLVDRVCALRSNCTAYDAVYIALAEALDATLITCDSRLADVPGVRASIDVFTR